MISYCLITIDSSREIIVFTVLVEHCLSFSPFIILIIATTTLAPVVVITIAPIVVITIAPVVVITIAPVVIISIVPVITISPALTTVPVIV